MEIQLKDEKTRNQNLINEINNLKNQIKENDMKNEIEKLIQEKNKLEQKLKNEIKELTNQNKNLKFQLENNTKTNNLKIISGTNFILNKKEKTMVVNFMPIDQSFISTISCKNTDILVNLEQKIYREYPQYKEFNTYLTMNGKMIKRFKTIEENGIQDSNSIIVNIYQ